MARASFPMKGSIEVTDRGMRGCVSMGGDRVCATKKGRTCEAGYYAFAAALRKLTKKAYAGPSKIKAACHRAM
jgi:hypothetical protein